jgi:hypothetical protein
MRKEPERQFITLQDFQAAISEVNLNVAATTAGIERADEQLEYLYWQLEQAEKACSDFEFFVTALRSQRKVYQLRRLRLLTGAKEAGHTDIVG